MKYELSLVIESMDRVTIDEKYYLNCKNGKIFVLNETGSFYIDDAQIELVEVGM